MSRRGRRVDQHRLDGTARLGRDERQAGGRISEVDGRLGALDSRGRGPRPRRPGGSRRRNARGYLHAYRTPSKVEANDQAWHWHQNDRATGHYGDDTRPPAAIRGLRAKRRGRSARITFRAPGDDWNAGTAARYELVVKVGRRNRIIAVAPRPKGAGAREAVRISLPRSARGTASRPGRGRGGERRAGAPGSAQVAPASPVLRTCASSAS